MRLKLRTALLSIRRWLTLLETVLAGASLLLLVALTLLQIVARNLFETGLPAADALTRHLVLYVTFFGAALAADAYRHIRIDVVAAWLSERWLESLYRPLQLIAGLVCILLTQAAIRFWIDEWQYAGAHERWQVLFNLILPVGFGLLVLHFLLGTLLGPRHSSQAR